MREREREREDREKKNANDVRELMCATVKAVKEERDIMRVCEG